jgi:hypothetical protein
MKTSVQKRFVRLSGLFLLSLLVVALAVQAAQAAQVQGTGAGSGTSTINTVQLPTLAQIQQHQGIGPYAPRVAAVQPLTQLQRAHGGLVAGSGTSNAAQPAASSGISSTTVWIAAVAVFGALLIGGWALARRRKQREAAPACELSASGC